jgi:hypothetical protein
VKAAALLAVLALAQGDDCGDTTDPAAKQQALEQAKALEQAHEAVGMPATPNWQEKRMVKDLYELRDKAIATNTYLVNEMRGCLVYLGPSVGYGLPYGTQYTAPTRMVSPGSSYRYSIPQAEPNGLYVPETAEGTWVMLKDPGGDAVKPVYVEPRVLVSPFRLPDQECKLDAPTSPKK